MKTSLFFLFIFIFSLGCLSPSSAESKIPKVCFGERCVLIEVADSPEERAKGLMYRHALSGNTGMLFMFETEDLHGFWMKNTLIALDAIWMDSNGKVVDIQSMLPCEKDPCKVYTPLDNAKYVLEVNVRVASRWNIKLWDFAQISGV